MSEQTVNDAGGCKPCGCKTFTVLEHLEYRCTVQEGVLTQDDGPIERSELVSIECTNCYAVYETGYDVGEVALKPIGA
jgi:hypothetical protein